MSTKIIGIHEKETIKEMLTYIESECSRVDVDQAFDEMLDECYSFDSVGGIFSSMCPSRVLKEVDPTAYRCGLNDWLDGERDNILEIGNDYYRTDDVKEAQESFVDDLNDKVSELESEISELESESEPDKNEIEKLQDEVKRMQSAIEACEDYAF